jgi:hypothetical protein
MKSLQAWNYISNVGLFEFLIIVAFFTILIRTLFYALDDDPKCAYCGQESKAAVESDVSAEEITTMMLRHIQTQKLTKKTSKGLLEYGNIISFQNILVYFVTRTMLPQNAEDRKRRRSHLKNNDMAAYKKEIMEIE